MNASRPAMIPPMRAVVVTSFGGPEVLEVRDEPDPVAGPDDLLVETEAIGVNYRDIYEREGRYGGEAPLITGVEGAGRVVAGPREGEQVAWLAAPGSYAEWVRVPADRAVPIPDEISRETAAAVILQGATAHYLATDVYPVREGDNVLIHAAAGGVGLLLTQIAKKLGARVIATTSGGEKAERARAAGADEVIGYEGFGGRVRELTQGEGVAVAYDGVGQATFDESLASVRTRGTMVLFGAASGPVPPFDPMRLEREGSVFLTRPGLRDYTTKRDELLARAADVFAWVADGSLEVRIGARYPLDEARRAQEDLAARRTTGKLLLLP
jgi:NADPH2:quinone reductase